MGLKGNQDDIYSELHSKHLHAGIDWVPHELCLSPLPWVSFHN